MNPIRTALAFAGVAALAGCEFPTEPPIVEQRWILPVENSTISVDELLPSGVSVSGSSFDVAVDPFSTSETLGNLCAACGDLQGQTVASPPFSGTFVANQSLPADVSAVTVTGGSVQVAIQNGLAFDPVAGGGSITITLTAGAGGAQLGQVVFDGTLPAGSTATRTLSLGAGSAGTTLRISAAVSSPGGQQTTINTAQRITVTATPTSILVGSATVNVANRTVDLDPVDLDVEDIDTEITDRIQQGGIVLDVTNPFAVSVSAQIHINYPGGKLTKTLSISAGATSTASLSYTGDEFRAFLGKENVTLTGSGTVSAAGGSITVRPGQEIGLDAKIDLTLKIG